MDGFVIDRRHANRCLRADVSSPPCGVILNGGEAGVRDRTRVSGCHGGAIVAQED